MQESRLIQSAIVELPLPLAQTLRRAVNAKSPQEQHNGAYYFVESALKLSASAQLGVYFSLGCPNSQLNQLVENLTRPSAGHWLALLRETAAYLAGRQDSGLLPLQGVYERLTRKLAMPAVKEFLEFAARSADKREGRQAFRVLDFFDAVVSYRNQELGHGAMRERAYYAEAAPLLLEAALEAVNALRPVGDMQFVVARDVVDARTQKASRRFDVLRGDGLHLPLETNHPKDPEILAGRLLLAAGNARVPLHPLLVYEIDKLDRDRVGFLNHVASQGRGDTQKLKRVEYLDYDSGDRLEGHDALSELAALLSRERGQAVSIEAVAALSQGGTEIHVGAAPSDKGQFIGDFELVEELGRGGMGIVYKARQNSLRRVVALKVLPPALAGDPVSVARFKREIAALGRCDHPNVVKVLTAGQDGERHFYAMEYVEGSDLAQVCGVLSQWKTGSLKEGHILKAITDSRAQRSPGARTGEAPLPDVPKAAEVVPEISEGRDYFTRLAEIVGDAASGVQHLHEHGIIHRDLKPANIMLTQDGKRAVIMDLGLAQLQDRSLSLTASSVKILGTLRYMPPEQLQHQMLEVTPKADIYSLGATLYELAALGPMFDGDTEARLMQQVLQEEPKSPRSRNAAVPRDLETIITVAAAKAPNDRYATAGALASDLRAFSRGEPISARAPTAFHYLRLFYRRNRALVHGLAAALVLLLALSVWFVINLDASRQDALTQRDLAEQSRREADIQRAKADDSAAEANVQSLQAKAQRARAEQNEKDAREAAAQAQRAERNARERLAESLLTKGNALLLAKRYGEARASFAESLAIGKELGLDDFDAQCGLSLCYERDPPPLLKFGLDDYGIVHALAPLAGQDGAFVACDAGVLQWRVTPFAFERVFTRQAGAVRSLAVSPDGKWLATGGLDGRVMIFDALSAALHRECVGHLAEVSNLAWREDGAEIASIDQECHMIVWNAQSGARQFELIAFEGNYPCITWCEQGAAIAAVCGRHLKVFSRETQLVTFEYTDNESNYFQLLALPGGGFAMAAGKGIELRDAKGKFSRLIELEFGPNCLALSRDGKRLAASASYSKWVSVDLATGNKLAQSSRDLEMTQAVCFLDERLMTADNLKRLALWSAQGECTSEYAGAGLGVAMLACARKGRVLYALSTEGEITAWDSWTSAEIARLQRRELFASGMALAPDESFLAVGSAEGSIHLLDPRTLKPLTSYSVGKNTVAALSLSPDGKHIACSVEAQLMVVDLQSGASPVVYEGKSNKFVFPKVTAWSPDGKLLAACNQHGRGILWELATPQSPRELPGIQSALTQVVFSGDSQYLCAATNDRRVVRFSIADLSVTELARDLGELSSLLIDNTTGALVVASNDPRANILRIDITQAKVIEVIERNLPLLFVQVEGSVIYGLAAGRVVAHALGPELAAFRLARAEPKAGDYRQLEVLPGGKLALVREFSGVELWDLETMSQLRRLTPQGFMPQWFCFDPARRCVLAISMSGEVLVVDLFGKELVQVEDVFERGQVRAAYHAATGQLAVLESDGSLITVPISVFFKGADVPDEFKGLDVEGAAEIQWSANGTEIVVVYQDGRARLLSAIDGKPLRPLVGGPAQLSGRCIAVSDDGKFVAAGYYEGIVVVWDHASGRFVRELGTRGGPAVSSACYSADSRLLIWTTANGRRVFDLAAGREVYFERSLRSLEAASFGPPLRRLVCAGAKGILACEDVEAGRLVEGRRELAYIVGDLLTKKLDDPALFAVLGAWYALRGCHERAVHFLRRAGELERGNQEMLAQSLWLLGRQMNDKTMLEQAAAMYEGLSGSDELEKTRLKLCAEACRREAR